MTDAFSMTATDVKVYQVESPLDPELVDDLCRSAIRIEELDSELGNEKWNIAGRVNGDWEEHKTMTYSPVPNEPPVKIFPSREAYYAECSRVANTVNRRKVFGESGQTLRRWCEVRATYENFQHAELFLEALSFDHLFKARKLYMDGCVKSPVLALAKAESEGWSADEMETFYQKDIIVTQSNFFDRAVNFLDGLIKPLNWNDKKRNDFFAEIKPIVERYLK